MINLKYFTETVKLKGKLVYEYNPLFNFRSSKDGNHYVKDKEGNYLDKDGKITTNNNLFTLEENGVIEDLITDGNSYDTGLNFSLNHPVDILCLPSYDGSVNLILNDDYNPPRLINTRFSVKELNTYERVDRRGNTDTNLYDKDEFYLDSSLYKLYNKIPKLEFKGVNFGGNLKVGNYHFYFKLCDADGNETDFVALSNLVSLFIGSYVKPSSVRGGQLDENSHKIVNFKLTNLDSEYDYITVYYTRSSGVGNQPSSTEYKKIDKRFRSINKQCLILITGFENIIDITESELNVEYFVASTAKTAALCQNMLFLGNVTTQKVEYNELTKLSLMFYPTYSATEQQNIIGKLNHEYLDSNYKFEKYKNEYYNPYNIYDHVGYWNEEMYRLGIVYIMNNNTLSPVFNIRGRNEIPKSTDNLLDFYTPLNKLNVDLDTKICDKVTLENSAGVVRINHIYEGSELNVYSLKIKFGLNENETLLLYNQLKKLKVKGYFFVRQTRIPTILAQAFTMPADDCSGIPLLYTKLNNYADKENYKDYNSGNYCYFESFLDNDLNLVHDIENRMFPLNIIEDKITNKVAFCPEFEINQPYFNSLFTGTNYPIKPLSDQLLLNPSFNNRHYSIDEMKYNFNNSINVCGIVSVAENSSAVRIKETNFKTRAGLAEDLTFNCVSTEHLFKGSKPESWKFAPDVFWARTSSGLSNETEEHGEDEDPIENVNRSRVIRGIYGPMLGLVGNDSDIKFNLLINIYIPDYDDKNISMLELFNIRIYDSAAYYPICLRTEFNELNGLYFEECFSGDCYISTFTHRVNRNFQDPDAPNNDEFVDHETWKNKWHFYTTNDDKKEENKGVSQESADSEEGHHHEASGSKRTFFVNRGDINAVQLGTWVTFKCYTSANLALRDWDGSNPEEEALVGYKRAFYPYMERNYTGNGKVSDSYMYNQGFSKSVSNKNYYLIPEVPYIKDQFHNRIIYSQPTAVDAFKNGYRTFKGISFRDYSAEYGSITKILEWHGNLCVIFEHAIGIVQVNQRALIPTDDGTQIAVGAVKVIPENISVITNTYGSQWMESIVCSDNYIYGFDTVAKKFWRTNGLLLELISDFKVLKFINDNMTLSEREITPIIGIRNVKTHYNANKKDIMFTFYDGLYGFEEKCWNICYNELLNSFTTFYSWIPSASENIDNIFFSYDRNSAKWISKLGISNSSCNDHEGICIIPEVKEDEETQLLYGVNLPKLGLDSWKEIVIDGGMHKAIKIDLFKRPLPEENGLIIHKSYKLEFDPLLNYKYFGIFGDYLYVKNESELKNHFLKKNPIIPVILLNIKCEILIEFDSLYKNPLNSGMSADWEKYFTYNYGYYQSLIALSYLDIIDHVKTYSEQWNIKDKPLPSLRTEFWKHGLAGIIDIADVIKPCKWYGKLHPFEFEFVVGNSSASYKQFTNMNLITNNVKPESFHYTVIGDSYDFSLDKYNMYLRQEATKALYLYNGEDIVYNHNAFKELVMSKIKPAVTSNYIESQNLRDIGYSNTYKATILPLYYDRIDTYNEIEDYYNSRINPSGTNYQRFSGGEVIYDEQLDQLSICNRVKARDIKEVGRVRGNIQYVGDRWDVLINPLILYHKNEDWTSVPPIITLNKISNYVDSLNIIDAPLDSDLWKAGYRVANRDLTSWDTLSKSTQECKLMDKYIRIKVRYPGDKLTLISAINTYYNTYA